MKRKPITLKRIFLETRSKLKYQRKYISIETTTKEISKIQKKINLILNKSLVEY